MRGYPPSKNRVDLHLHTDASDGVYPPAEVIKLAARAGLKAAAVTDHDTLEGIPEALRAGKEWNIEVVPGVEISVLYQGGEFHLLGYYPARGGELEKALQFMREERYRRMQLMLDRLRDLEIRVSWEEVLSAAGKAAPGRLHLARVLVKKGYCPSTEEAFQRFLDRGRPAYVPRETLSAAQALRLLLKDGAVPVLAHPGEKGKTVLRNLVRMGLRGVEVYHPDHHAGLQEFYRGQALDLGLFITGGSDFHGDFQTGFREPGSISVPYRCLEQLKRVVRRI